MSYDINSAQDLCFVGHPLNTSSYIYGMYMGRKQNKLLKSMQFKSSVIQNTNTSAVAS